MITFNTQKELDAWIQNGVLKIKDNVKINYNIKTSADNVNCFNLRANNIKKIKYSKED